MENLKPKVIILPGWMGSFSSWATVKNLLEIEGYQTFVVDFPGFSIVPAPPVGWEVKEYVEWFKDWLNENGIDNFFLFGHSFGGRVAIKFADYYPKRLLGLILCSAAGVTPRPRLKIFIFGAFSKISNFVLSFPLLKFLRQPMRKVVYLLGGGRDYYLINTEVMKETFKKTIEEDLTPHLEKINVPTMIVWGTKDVITPLADAKKLHQGIRGSILKTIPGKGHNLNYQCPEIVARLISEFIQSQS